MKSTFRILLAIASLAFICFSLSSGEPAAAEATSLAAVGVFAFGDALLQKTKALPNGAAAITSDAIDLGQGANIEKHEFVISAPALTTAQLPNTQTMTYALVTSPNANLSSPTVINASALVQTGADGAGAAAADVALRLPTVCDRYVGVKATKSGAGDASAASVTIALKF